MSGKEDTVSCNTLFPLIGAITKEVEESEELQWLQNESFIPCSVDNKKSFVDTLNADNISLPVEKYDRCLSSDSVPSTRKRKRTKKTRHTSNCSKNDGNLTNSNTEAKVACIIKKHSDKVFIEEVRGLDPQFAFRVDRKAQGALLEYESLCKSHIAQYYRMCDACFGNRAVLLKKTSNVVAKDRVTRYFSKKGRYCVRLKGSFVKVDKNASKMASDYISIQEKVSKENNEHVLTMKNIASSDLFSDKSNTAGCISNSVHKDPDSFADEMFEKTAYYNCRLREEPTNVNLWMEFVSFQDAVFRDARFSTLSSVAMRRLKEVYQPPRACIDKKLAIIDKALIANPSSLELKICRLEIGSSVMDSALLSREWDNLLFVHAGDIWLWRRYLIFQQTCLQTFSVGRIVKLYKRCFRMLISLVEKGVKVARSSENLEEGLMKVFEQYCSFLHLSGYTEKSIALCQALIEFNLFRPVSLNLTSTEDCIATFVDFWNSGEARFGEPNAKGWSTWVDGIRFKGNRSIVHADTEDDQQNIINQIVPVHEIWLQLEQLRESAHYMPWRPNMDEGETEEDCEDIDRLVLFNDIRPILFRLLQSQNCLRLVLFLVRLLGMKCGRKLQDHVSEMEQFDLLDINDIPCVIGLGADIMFIKEIQPHKDVMTFLEGVLRQAAIYFSSEHRSSFTTLLLHFHQVNLSPVDYNCDRSDTTKCLLKIGKDLLKETPNRNDLFLWNSYIRSIWANCKADKALSMLHTALAMFTGKVNHDDQVAMAGLCSLYHTYAEINLGFTPLELKACSRKRTVLPMDSKNIVIVGLMCMVDSLKFPAENGPTAISGAAILRARRKFQFLIGELMAKNSITPFTTSVLQHTVHRVGCFALYELITLGVTNMIQMFDNVLSQCSVKHHMAESETEKAMLNSLDRELTLLCMFAVQNCVSVGLAQSKILHDRLKVALACYPDEPVLLRLMLDLDFGMRIKKGCNYFTNPLMDPKSIFPVLFKVFYEIKRHRKLLAASVTSQTCSHSGSSSGSGFNCLGTVHRVRAAFEHGLHMKVAEHCPLLWRLYMHFEMTYGTERKARGVLYRSLQSCPWAKSLYLDGAGLFGETQMKELLDLMIEKEIRVQAPLEEVELLVSSVQLDSIN